MFVFPHSFVILYVMARDEDEGENGRVSYRIQAGNGAGRFTLNPNTGEFIFRFEKKKKLFLKIM